MQKKEIVHERKISPAYLGILFILGAFFLSGCGKTNIGNVNPSLTCQTTHTFAAANNGTWKAVVAAVTDLNGIRMLDKSSGLISSKVATVDGQELSMFDTAFFGQTYKYSYEIVVAQGSGGNTNVTAHVKLILNQFWFVMNREQKVESVESYLREKLFKSICNNLFPGRSSNCIRSIQCTHRKSRSAYDTNPGIWASGSSSTSSSSSSVVKRTNATVKSVQLALIEKGYRPGPADGLMGKKTKNALKQFQRDNQLPVTGSIDLKTKNLLLSSSITPKPQPKHQPKTETTAPGVETSEQYVVKAVTELKASQGPFSTTIKVLPKDSFVTFVSSNGDWSKVEYQGETGYVFSDFLQQTTLRSHVGTKQKQPKSKEEKDDAVRKNPVSETHPAFSEPVVKTQPVVAGEPKAMEKSPARKIRYGVVNERTDVMSQASTFADQVKSVATGTRVEILETKQDFLRIRTGETEGYIYADFVDLQN